MPELPEVETVRRGLAPLLVGRRIAGVKVRRRDLRRLIVPDFARRLEGGRVAQTTAHPRELHVKMAQVRAIQTILQFEFQTVLFPVC